MSRTTMRREREREMTARHEVGHALMCLLKGVPFDRVWVGQSNSGPDALGGIESDDFLEDADEFTPQQREDAGVITMASLAGERINRSCGSAWRGWRGAEAFGVSGDIDQIHQYLSRRVWATADEVDRWPAKAHALLTEHAAAHQRLTDALIERGRLDYSECITIRDEVERSAECAV
jgi:ATP-dependent Zn protease